MTTQAQILKNIFEGQYSMGKKAGEYLESIRNTYLTVRELEEIALVLCKYQHEFKANKHFNQDYRDRTLAWLHSKKESPVMQIAHAVLYRVSAFIDNRPYNEEKGENEIRDAVNSAAEGNDIITAMSVYVVATHKYYDAFKEKIDDYFASKNLVLENIWLAEAIIKQYPEHGHKPSKLYKAFFRLYYKNVSEVSPDYKILSSFYDDIEITYMNLIFITDMGMASSIIKDNIIIHFIQKMVDQDDKRDIREYEANKFKELLSGDFSRNVQGSDRISTFFSQVAISKYSGQYYSLENMKNWKKLYETTSQYLSFKHKGFLSFDPTIKANKTKWNLLCDKHKAELLEDYCSNIISTDLQCEYPHEWKVQAEYINDCLLTSMISGVKNDTNEQTQFDPLDHFSMSNTLNVLIQAGLRPIPSKTTFWKCSINNNVLVQYLDRYININGTTPEWLLAANNVGDSVTEWSKMIVNTSFDIHKKKMLFAAVLDTAWKLNPYMYWSTIRDLFLCNSEAVNVFFDAEERNKIIHTLINYAFMNERSAKSLLKLTMTEEEWEETERIAKEEEQKKEEKLQFQKKITEIRNSVAEFLKTDCDIYRLWKVENCLLPDFAKIASRHYLETAGNATFSEKVFELARIAKATNCDLYLLSSLKEMEELKN